MFFFKVSWCQNFFKSISLKSYFSFSSSELLQLTNLLNFNQIKLTSFLMNISQNAKHKIRKGKKIYCYKIHKIFT